MIFLFLRNCRLFLATSEVTDGKIHTKSFGVIHYGTEGL